MTGRSRGLSPLLLAAAIGMLLDHIPVVWNGVAASDEEVAATERLGVAQEDGPKTMGQTVAPRLTRDVDDAELIKQDEPNDCRVLGKENEDCWTAAWSSTRQSAVPANIRDFVSVNLTNTRKHFKAKLVPHNATIRWSTNVYVLSAMRLFCCLFVY